MHPYSRIREIQCFSCANFIGKRKGEVVLHCKAFSSGIPEDILIGEFNHIKKYPSQKNDIVFEKIKK